MCSRGQPLFWDHPAQGHGWALVIVIVQAPCREDRSLRDCIQVMLRELFIVDGSIKPFDTGVLLRLSRLDVSDLNLLVFSTFDACCT
jgi:hypothetical protein